MTKTSELSMAGAAAGCRPLIKWPGGKRTLASRIREYFPSSFGTYYEPFFGGGAVYFSVAPPKAILADINEDLINAYIHIRDDSEALIAVLKKYKNSESAYYKVRSAIPTHSIERAARFLYLTRLSFNGIHRVNLKGEFNVPYGYKEHLSPVDATHLAAASLALKDTTLLVADFELSTAKAKKGDVVYFDPPYTVAHANNGFVKYNERIFSWHDQERLAGHAKNLAKRGCRVVVSNADHASIHSLYEDFDCEIIERSSVIAASGAHRRTVSECIFVLGGKK